MANCEHPPPNSGYAPRRLYQNQNGTAPQPIIGTGGKDMSSRDNNEQIHASHQQSLPHPIQGGQAPPKSSHGGGHGGSGKFNKKDKTAEVIMGMDKMSIEESLKLHDSNNLAMKTPVSILQELLSRRGITPSYELIQMEGAIHEPTFRYRVSFNDKDVPFTAMGAGRSKKEAKHSAARALIDKLTGVQLPESQANDVDANSNCGGGGGDTKGGYSEKVMGNPIGWLQEMCMSRRWPPPTYETEMEVGLPHERLFTIACTILNFREMGKGKSKKIAKRFAASKMWQRLQENPLDNAQVNDAFRTGLDDEKTCLKAPSLNHIQLLAEIAQENQFEVTYVDIEEKTISNQCQCLVQLSTLPVAVCHGSGATLNDAQRHAAQNALEYLKIMTKK
ncbi:interferon-inducible double-stranded RNA-dependent protein kinase activator A homolog isoform X2 [Episyrphus balteatus]|uniref:interferon-inducible double-stranded RNA-dependent protein kinase activator A homolog isoform X2 n=1 Tax=Episyrphus balteatus TaxID=286459 RepID=UPI0024861D76|nr:interferon-inducible double-stranded RNA-dependent protein kinase activator A homolog isoform X2 [Episyrphus balteatus]